MHLQMLEIIAEAAEGGEVIVLAVAPETWIK